MLKQHPDAISHGRMRAFDAPTMLDSLVGIAMDAESLIMERAPFTFDSLAKTRRQLLELKQIDGRTCRSRHGFLYLRGLRAADLR